VLITDTSQAAGTQDCRIGVALAPDLPYRWYRSKVAAAREFSERTAWDSQTLVVIDDALAPDVVKRMPMEDLFLPWPPM
jgi:hypothetical protein